MKCDDDIFVNVPNLVHVLLGGTVPVYKSTLMLLEKLSVDAKRLTNGLADDKFLLLGFKICSSKPNRDFTNKWFVPRYMYSDEFYPDYVTGGAYVMTIEAAQRLYKSSLTTPLFLFEDVYLTGIVAEKINLKRQHHSLFFYPLEDMTDDERCSLRGMLTQHRLAPMSFESAYLFIIDASVKCDLAPKNFKTNKLRRKRCD